jgi:hypothetical protein
VGLVLTPTEDDAAYVAASISTSGLGHMHAIFAAIQSLDLPDVWLDARLL